MIYNKAVLSTVLLAGSAAAFAPSKTAFVSTASSVSSAYVASLVGHTSGCPCPACSVRSHPASCACSACSSHTSGCVCTMCRSTTMLFSTTETAAEDVPVEVEALDGIESEEEAHNSDRPARKALKKKPAVRGKPLSEFKVGDTVKAKVKTITTYGAFLDIGASTDGLLHISQLSVEFVSDVSTILVAGQELDVRITNIDEAKGQVALTMLSADEEVQAKEAANRSRQPREGGRAARGAGGGGGGSNRRDDGAVLSALAKKGWNSDTFVEGKVVSTVDFGAFVRIDASQLAEGVEGEFDGLVHISAMAAGRVGSVSSIVSPEDKVQVRVKAISGGKVSLSMVSPEDEAAKAESSGGGSGQTEGAKDWKESLAKMKGTMPEFKNKPMVVDMRK